jgi:serine protease AprX
MTQLQPRRHWALLFAITAVVAALGGSGVAQATATATLSQPVQQWLETAAAGDTFDTIVTFDDASGFATLGDLGVDAARLTQLPVAFAKLSPDQVRALAASPGVRSLWHEQKMDLYLHESVPLVGADKVWAGSGLRTPYTGTGVSVAVIDTGADGTHPDLPAGAKLEGWALAGNPDVFDRGEKEPMAFAPAPTGDTYGHGTHVSSTVGGLGLASLDDSRMVGMAPGSKIFSFKTDIGPFLFGGYILASFDWILAYNADPANTQKIRVSSNSWGCCDGSTYNPDDPINVATKALYDAGVNVVFAAGNSGGPDTLNRYAASPWVIAVAAGTKDRALASFSSRGRFDSKGGTEDINWDRKYAQRNNSGLYRPALTAPGEDILAAKSTTAAVMADGTELSNPMYTWASGTSMATPHVAGAIALMLEARPGLQPSHVISILEGTATNMPAYELFEAGTGYLDAHAAVVAAEKGKIGFPPATNGKTPEFTLTSATPYSGNVAPSTWLVRECPDTTGALDHHQFDVTAGTDAIYAELDWASETQLIYLVLYDPQCNEAAASAALLDIGSVKHRELLVTAPAAGTWTVGVYGRINLPTDYTGSFNTYDKR